MQENLKVTFWDVTKGTCAIIFMIGLSVKIYNIPITLNVDFPTLLSLLLALFSVGLSAIFYFKATDTSNNFYDNTHKFTRDIAQLIVKMESGFGEKLRNLDEGYNSMRGYMQNGWSGQGSENAQETKEQLKQEKEEIKKVVEERNSIVQGLIERSQLEAEEKEKISIALREKESEISVLQTQVARLNRRRALERVRTNSDAGKSGLSESARRVSRYIRSRLLDTMGGAEYIAARPIRAIIRVFRACETSMHPSFMEDLDALGFYKEDQLTVEGARFIKQEAKEYLDTIQE